MAVHYLLISIVGQRRGYFFYYYREEKALWHVRGIDLVHTQLGGWVTPTRTHYCNGAKLHTRGGVGGSHQNFYCYIKLASRLQV